MNNTSPLICLENVSYAYPEGRQVLRDLTLTLAKGDRLGLIGHNGSGKTTLFHVIMGLLVPVSGQITLFGQTMQGEIDFSHHRHRIGLLFQDADDQLFSPTVLEDVAFGPLNMGKSREEAIAISRRVLSYLQLEGFEQRITFRLSGGEKRLVSLATVLAMEPEVLLLDEPTTGLDPDTKNRLIDVLNNLDLAYILISHEIDFLAQVTNTIYAMENGTIRRDEQLHIHRHEHAHKHGSLPHQHE